MEAILNLPLTVLGPILMVLTGLGYEVLVNQGSAVFSAISSFLAGLNPFGGSQPDAKRAFAEILSVREYFQLAKCQHGVLLADELGKCLFEHDGHAEPKVIGFAGGAA